jgi:hypothetical protein
MNTDRDDGGGEKLALRESTISVIAAHVGATKIVVAVITVRT